MGLAFELKQERRRRAREAALRATRGDVPPLRIERTGDGPAVLSIITAIHLVVDGVKYLRGQATQLPQGLAGRLQARGLVWVPRSSGVDWWTADGRVLAVEPCADQPLMATPSVGALRIAQMCGYDPGNAVYRFHSAVNEHLPHASAFITWRTREGNPFSCPEQYSGLRSQEQARALVYEADVLHQHVDYFAKNTLLGIRPRKEQVLIRHYHGSMPDGAPQHAIINQGLDDTVGAALVGARLTLCALRPGRMAWLPIAVPVARYAAMVAPTAMRETFRIAHSATKEEYKGTRDFVDVCDALRKRGVPVEPVLIGYQRRRGGRRLEPAHMTHAEALKVKASCDATFDSFWLGIQGSGIEGAAMGHPVLAGDASVRDLYREQLGECPYTYVPDKAHLREAIERLATDAAYCATEAERVGAYVRAYHDYPAVAQRYAEILRWAKDWEHTDLPRFPAPTPERVPPTRQEAA